MTTAKTRRSKTTAGLREGTTAKHAGKANEAIPVLIRLPRLVIELEPSDASSAAEDEAGIRATIPLQATAAALEPLLPVPDDARMTTDETAGGFAPGAAFQMHSPRRSPWLSFRFPRWAINAGIAVGLIVVFILAFSAIRDPLENSDKVAEFEPAGTLPVLGIPASQTPPLPPPLPPLPPAQTPAPTSPAASAPAAPTPRVPGMAKEETASSEKTPATPAVPKPNHAKDAPAAVEPQALPRSVPEPPASSMPAAAAVPAPPIPATAGPPVAAERRSAETARHEADLPLTSGPAVTEPSASAGPYGYPETNPTTFQYPVDYHLHLRSQNRARSGEIHPGTGEPIFNGPTASGAAANGRQPNTARLQPRIEPPPIR